MLRIFSNLNIYARLIYAVAVIFPFLSKWTGIDPIKGIFWPYSHSFAALAGFIAPFAVMGLWGGQSKKRIGAAIKKMVVLALVCGLAILFFHVLVPENWSPSDVAMRATWTIVAAAYILEIFAVVAILVLASLPSRHPRPNASQPSRRSP
jgi:hypothetical protein